MSTKPLAFSPRLCNCVEGLKKNERKALIPYVISGFPEIGSTCAVLQAMVVAGADILELGLPFSDPMADGPVIQEAHEQALRNGATVESALVAIRAFREGNNETPIIVMTYLNPIERFGFSSFLTRLKAAGGDGLLVVDAPIPDGQSMVTETQRCGLDWIFLVAPTTTPERISQVLAQATGYIYYVSIRGVTGAQSLIDIPAVSGCVASLQAQTALPIGVGFGINDGRMALQVAKVADAVIIGSKLLQILSKESLSSAVAFLSSIRAALDAAV